MCLKIEAERCAGLNYFLHLAQASYGKVATSACV